MRVPPLVLLALTAACVSGCGSTGDECRAGGETNDCPSGDVCARSSECLPASEVRSVHVSWTVRGQVPTATNCAPAMSLYLLFYDNDPGDTFGYEPVPCVAGLFTIDKLPRRFIGVEIGKDGGFSASKSIDSSDGAMFDLAP